jgi:hypothetical protein
MMQTQQPDLGEQLQSALAQPALDQVVSDEDKSSLRLTNEEKRIGEGRAGPGRPKGSSNRVTKTIRDAVEAASQPGACHPEGLAGWLIERAHGALGDRQIFAAMVSKAMPLQVQANVDGGIRLELGWLGGRGVGATAAQIPEARTQVLDLERDSAGGYRIKDPKPAGEGGLAGDDAVVDAQQKGPGDAQGA